MPGTIPGVLGVVAFGGIKLVGYSLAVSGLKEVEPTIASPATKIAAVRTGLGVILGPLATVFVVKSRFWFYALVGALVSRLLDWPGYALAIAAPGKIVFC